MCTLLESREEKVRRDNGVRVRAYVCLLCVLCSLRVKRDGLWRRWKKDDADKT